VDAKTTNLEITARELKDRIDQGNAPFILDIREPAEVGICALNNGSHIPMQQLPERFQELNDYKDKDLVVYCHFGGRSAKCAEFLRAKGYKSVLNLTGGISAWTDQVDPNMPRY